MYVCMCVCLGSSFLLLRVIAHQVGIWVFHAEGAELRIVVADLGSAKVSTATQEASLMKGSRAFLCDFMGRPVHWFDCREMGVRFMHTQGLFARHCSGALPRFC